MQRITALNLFLKDIYNEGRILSRRHRSSRDRLQLQAIPPPDDRPAGSAKHLHRHLRNRSDSPGEWRVRRARRQSSRPQRRQLHADQPPRDEAHLPAALPQLQRAAHRAVHAAAARHPALARPGRPSRAKHRSPVARRLQLRVLRARLSRAPDGNRTGRRPRPRRSRQRRLHADHQRPASRGRDLPSRRRRLHRSAGISARTQCLASPASSTPIALAT